MRISVYVLVMSIMIGWSAVRAGWPHRAEAQKPSEAAKLQNPVVADAASIEAGKALFAEQCAGCHGDTGKGDGPNSIYTGDPPPSDLTDATWKHGSTDGEIFIVIRDGVEETGMEGFGKDLKSIDMWHLVNFMRTLGPKPATAH